MSSILCEKVQNSIWKISNSIIYFSIEGFEDSRGNGIEIFILKI
jgi:hypothetical protein